MKNAVKAAKHKRKATDSNISNENQWYSKSLNLVNYSLSLKSIIFEIIDTFSFYQ
ncbi:hypothetical protein KSU1_D0702 [Candidatus Jettenia caeni]|uniref:Uncharacterized protein n=1 Tax=Candidatus Jettenia caeni TaxID=247490 RepID=I3IQL6_9BACT|nr:hypothetical protein KSU1_D0702 [Candidatus Jettenia caeni]GJQ47322.1 MAG: hypothetical protein JETCAE04_30760 [Candidatus Jettenia caeni]